LPDLKVALPQSNWGFGQISCEGKLHKRSVGVAIKQLAIRRPYATQSAIAAIRVGKSR